MANYLFEVQEKNRLAQKGVLKRFSINCIGHQETVEEMKAEKAEKFIELKGKKNDPEYEEWFLRYRPLDGKNKDDNNPDETGKPKKTRSNKKKKRKTRKRKGLFNF